jgi:arylsulfatase A-like enzyme
LAQRIPVAQSNGRGSAAAAALLAAALLCVAELAAYAPAADAASPRVWLLVLALYAAFGLALAALAAALVRLTGSRLSARDAVAALLLAGAGSLHLAPYILPRLAAFAPRAAGFALLAAALVAGYAAARLLLWRGPGGDRAGLVATTAGLAVAAAALAALRSARRIGALSEVALPVALAAAAGLVLVALLAARRSPAGLAAHRSPARLAGAVLVAAGALVGLRLAFANPHGWLALAPAPGAPPAPAGPPVLLIVFDTFRADALDLADEHGRTPNLARLARRADVFDDAIANASWTLPGHASLFTGLTLGHHRTDQSAAPGFGSTLPAEIPTVHELFARQGYRTACITANGIVGAGSGLARGCQRYANPSRDWLNALLPWRLLGETLASSGAFSSLALDLAGVHWNAEGREIVDLALEALGDDGAGQYLFLNFLDVHGPLPPDRGLPQDARRRLRLDTLQRMVGAIDHDTIWRRNRETLRASYDAQVTRLDAELGRLLDALEARGALDPAVVVVTADHGEAFVENPERRGYFGHHSAFEPAVRIPLILKRPGQREGRRRALPVQQVDVLPSLLAAAGLPESPPVDGASLLGDPPARLPITEWYARSDGGTFPYFPFDRLAIYDGRFKYVRQGDGSDALFDLEAAPFESADVGADHPELKARLSGALDAALRAPSPARAAAPGKRGGIDEQLRALGYVE